MKKHPLLLAVLLCGLVLAPQSIANEEASKDAPKDEASFTIFGFNPYALGHYDLAVVATAPAVIALLAVVFHHIKHFKRPNPADAPFVSSASPAPIAPKSPSTPSPRRTARSRSPARR